jgi:outer membrane murein-binding lipoprotein Lpp
VHKEAEAELSKQLSALNSQCATLREHFELYKARAQAALKQQIHIDTEHKREDVRAAQEMIDHLQDKIQGMQLEYANIIHLH